MPSERDTNDETPQDQWGPQSQFRIFALGENFDVEAYLETASAPLQFDQIWFNDRHQATVNSGIAKGCNPILMT
jgi:hypothetical protein